MLISFAIRPDYLTNRGGDTFQLLKTIEYLEKYEDVECSVITSPAELSSNVDVLHIFNLQNTKMAYNMVKAAKTLSGIKIVLSPIIWRFGDAGYVNKVMRLTRSMGVVRKFQSASLLFEKYSVSRLGEMKRYILENVDLVIPNSDEEGDILKNQYGIKFKQVVVPNCVDIKIQETPKPLNIPSDFVLEVGRIEPTKNQLSLLEALMDYREIPLVFVGKQNDRKKFYVELIKRLAIKRGNTYLINELPQNQLAAYYKAAKVHVLPSFRESPGLVTLEALFYGCNIVTSDERYCPIKYYQFDKLGYTCDPYSLKSIQKAVISAYDGNRVKIPDNYFEFFSYQNAAKITRNAYLEMLNTLHS